MIMFKLFKIGSIQTNVCKHTKDNGSNDIHRDHVMSIRTRLALQYQILEIIILNTF